MERTACRLALLVPLVSAAHYLAWSVRYDFQLSEEELASFLRALPWVLGIKLVAAFALRGWHEWMRYIAFRDLVALVGVMSLSSVGLVVCDQWVLSRYSHGLGIPLSVTLLDFVFSLLLVGGLCSAWRFRREHLVPLIRLLAKRSSFRRALVVGANRTTVVLANQIQFHGQLRYDVVGLLDDDARLAGTRYGGLYVYGGLDQAAQLIRRSGAEELFVLEGSLTGVPLRKLFDEAAEAGAKVRMLANVYDLLRTSSARNTTRLPLPAVRDIDIHDLLRREPAVLDNVALVELLGGQTVLVTGAGGSIGSEICRQVLRFKPRKLLLAERAENSLFHIDRELKALAASACVEPLIADVADERRMRQIFEHFAPSVVFHAAAHKHVPMMEANPSEAIANNVFGTKLVADLAHEHGVATFVLISTDKAVRPTSVMGLTKQVAERYIHSLASSSSTRYVVVRFGNVLGSAGSVVPIFQEQIRRGGPVTVTHPEMRRYFMTIPEASQLVLQAGAMGAGGEIFVLEMGEPVRIVDLARDMIRLSGFSEDEIEIEFTGMRPGEKLFEELYFDEEQTLPTRHPKLRVAYFRPSSIAEIDALLEELQLLVHEPEPLRVRKRLQQLFPDFLESSTEIRPASPRAVPHWQT
jgi:FlaA1/EpsC-like NDP-sugar epimerase